jgi:hypothetical protein
MADAESSICAGCGTSLPYDDDRPLERRTPCPKCGSRNRTIEAAAVLTGHVSMSADALIVRAWDGNSLTLFGVLYGIVVTAVGVVIATASIWWLIAYVVAALGLLAVLLLFFGQPIIGGMRWLIERGSRIPPRPFGRKFRRSK